MTRAETLQDAGDFSSVVPTDARLPFANRTEAGRALARRLARHGDAAAPPLVLALPRGGVPVAFEVALALRAPMDVFVVRKLGLPGNEEVAIGALASGGVRVLDRFARAMPAPELEALTAREQTELERREQAYRGGRAAMPIQGRRVLVVDDGLATGATMEAAVRALRRLAPSYLCAAVPVASAQAIERIEPLVDDVVCVARPNPFGAVSLWYTRFPQVDDEEVCNLLVTVEDMHEP